MLKDFLRQIVILCIDKKTHVKNGLDILNQVIFFTGTPSFTPDPNKIFEADCYIVKEKI